MSHKVLIVTNVQGMLMISLKKMLENQACEVETVLAEIKEVTSISGRYDAVLFYADEEFSKNQQIQIYLRDYCVEEDVPIYLIGDQDELDEIGKIISKNSVTKCYTRPVNVSEVASDISEYLKESKNHSKKKILVVDDSGAMLRNVKGWLEDRYQVILANSGAMAIKYLTLNRPDLVLLDYEMPVVDGAQVLEMIRSEVEFADVPVIFLTSKNDKESVANVVRLKPDGYLLKTMKPEEIVRSVDDFFIRQKSKKM